ncbi:hypothetical protein SDC9_88232 [bioreactor metagenome]|uniref:Uncharacterized protein n=1 Tax=bioreactor metagenome TaxID=1076179 RepID=A0A644ZLI8_9ZZZZ
MPAQPFSTFIRLGYHHHGIPADKRRYIAGDQGFFRRDDRRISKCCVYVGTYDSGRGSNTFLAGCLGKLGQQVIGFLVAFVLDHPFQ